jgi:hypothetical protein
MTRLPLETWENIFRNLLDLEPEDYYDGVVDWVEVMWLDNGDSSEGEWCLCYGEEMFEDGFANEREADERLKYLEMELLK